MLLKYDRISCINNAALVMSYRVKYLVGDKVFTLEWGSGEFPVGQSRECNLTEYIGELKDADLIWIEVNAMWGSTKESDDHIQYGESGYTATYEVTGTTLDFNITLK